MAVQYGFRAEEVVAAGRITRSEIESIKEWCRDEDDVPDLVDEQIVNFVLSCVRDLDFTKKTIKEFYRARRTAPELFNDRDVGREDLKLQLATLEYIELPKRTEDGCAILYHKLYDTAYWKYNMGPSMKLLFMTLDAALYNYPPTGLVMLFDMKGVGLLHLTRVKLNLIKVFCHYLQEGLPVKLREVHVFNSAYFIDKVLAILKPFLKKELYQILHFYPPGLDMELFYEQYVSKTCLPVDYGGDLPDTRKLHEENIKRLGELKPFFDAEENQRLCMK